MQSPRSLISVLFLCLALSACSLMGRPDPGPAAPSGGTRPVALGLSGNSPDLASLFPDARQRAFAAALADGLGKALALAPDKPGSGDPTVLSGSGLVGEFRVARQQILVAGQPVDDVAVAVRQGRVLVVRNNALVRLDPELAPLFPDHGRTAPRFAGMAVDQVRFEEAAGGGVACRLALLDLNQAPNNLAAGLADPPLPAPIPDRADEPLLQEADIPFDALVVDARDCDLVPSRLIRLLAPGGAELYGPGRVDPGILVQRGPAGFTTTYEKALVILSAWGAANPLTVRCERATGPESIVLSATGAEALVQADAQSGFLRQGRVVVLLPGGQDAP